MNDTVTDTTVKPNLNEFRDKLWTGIIGQCDTKRELQFHLDGYLYTHHIPHLALIGGKGQGKTRTARTIARGLFDFDDNGAIQWGYYHADDSGKAVWRDATEAPAGQAIRPKRKPLIEVNCASIHNLKAFINWSIKNVVDKNVTLFFDELSALKDDVSDALLNILEPNETHKTSYLYDEYVCDFDFKRQSFIFATAESQKVEPMLMDRFEKITFQEYSLQDLADIVKLNLVGIDIDPVVLGEVSTVLRGNGRAAFKMAEKIKSYLRSSTVFGRADWESLKTTLTIRPLGLNPIEVQILQILRQHQCGTSLTSLSAKTGMSREQLRQDSELYLLKHGLMEISTTGRVITALGLDYLKQLGCGQPAA